MKIRWLSGERLSCLGKAKSNPAVGEARNKARWVKLKDAVKSQESEAPLNARVGCTQKENWLKFCLMKRWTRYTTPDWKKESGEVKPQSSGILHPSPGWGWAEEPYKTGKLSESLQSIYWDTPHHHHHLPIPFLCSAPESRPLDLQLSVTRLGESFLTGPGGKNL